MDRIEAMKAYKVRQEQKAKGEADAVESKRAELALGIRGLKDRIQKLIETANACIENGIPIEAQHRYYGYDTWENGEFFTNAVSHKVGFVKKRILGKVLNEVEYMGIDGGGANGEHYLRTNGDCVICAVGNPPEIYQMNKFLEDFESFETAFYAYIDKIVEQ